MHGQRFHGVGLWAGTVGVRIDLYDSSGDYEASGIDRLEMHSHGRAQDHLGQIMTVDSGWSAGHPSRGRYSVRPSP